MRLIRSDEQAHLCEVQNTKSEHFISKCSRDRGKEDAITWGDLRYLRRSQANRISKKFQKSAEVIVGSTSLDEFRETSVTEGLNVVLLEIRIRANKPIIG